MIDQPAKAPTAGLAPPSPDSATRRWVFLYLGVLIVLLSFGSPSGGLIEIPISFFLKNKLHLEAHEVATFRLIAAVPVYLSFVFGFIRDTWNPFGMRDRGYMLLFGVLAAVIYGIFAFVPFSYASLLAAVVLVTSFYLFVVSAQNGLTSVIGQQHFMSGQISAVWNVAASIPVIAALLLGGVLSDWLERRSDDEAAQILFLVGGTFMMAVATYSIWRPRYVFDNIHPERPDDTKAFGDLRRLLRHWPIYPALLIWLLWNFAPGSATPLQYHLQNSLNATDAQWGLWNAIFAASFIPTFMLFGHLSRKLPLRTLLWWGTVVAVPQLVPLLFLNSITAALIAAVPSGLMGGVATAAYVDLLIRSCPPGRQGTIMMMSATLLSISIRFGDVLGTHLYDRYGGFTVCVIATTAVYALILPAILLVPRDLISTPDGQRPKP
jgi:hypothetical protein